MKLIENIVVDVTTSHCYCCKFHFGDMERRIRFLMAPGLDVRVKFDKVD